MSLGYSKQQFQFHDVHKIVETSQNQSEQIDLYK